MEYKIKKIEEHKLFKYLPEKLQYELLNIAISIMDIPKGMLMLDEPPLKIRTSIEETDSDNREQLRQKFVKTVISTPFADCVSSIAFQEDMMDSFRTRKDKLLMKSLKDQGLILGFSANKSHEKLLQLKDFVTVGLVDLGGRCKRYRKQFGFKFAVWKIFIVIGDNIPSHQSINLNARGSAKFASTCQSEGLVPVVRFELSDQGSHSLDEARNILEKILIMTFRSFGEQHVFLEGLLLQISLVRGGIYSDEKNTAEEIINSTRTALSRTVLTATKGIIIITDNLNEEEFYQLAKSNDDKKNPWLISFSIGGNAEMVAIQEWKWDLSTAPLVRTAVKDTIVKTMALFTGHSTKKNTTYIKKEN